jgi:predicted transcriptional regulator
VKIIQKHSRNRHRERHRGEYEIINEILKTVSSFHISSNPNRNKCKSIDIVYGCCLTWHQFQVYRNHLLGLNLLGSMKIDGNLFYEITEKGLEYLRLFSKLQAEMEPITDLPSTRPE